MKINDLAPPLTLQWWVGGMWVVVQCYVRDSVAWASCTGFHDISAKFLSVHFWKMANGDTVTKGRNFAGKGTRCDMAGGRSVCNSGGNFSPCPARPPAGIRKEAPKSQRFGPHSACGVSLFRI